MTLTDQRTDTDGPDVVEELPKLTKSSEEQQKDLDKSSSISSIHTSMSSSNSSYEMDKDHDTNPSEFIAKILPMSPYVGKIPQHFQ